MKLINDIEKINDTIEKNDFVLGYFTTTTCNVCKDLLPKIEKMIEKFPNIIGVKAEADVEKRIAGEFSVFAVPTIILFIEGKETFRYARNVGIEELTEKIERYYKMFF
jgi:thioredoxin-like negative regulator of GroEL